MREKEIKRAAKAPCAARSEQFSDELAKLKREVERLREIQECGGIDRYNAMMMSRALNSSYIPTGY